MTWKLSWWRLGKKLANKKRKSRNSTIFRTIWNNIYTRKNSVEIHGVPESAYTSTEEVVLKLAAAENVDVTAEDIEISHKLNRKGVKPIIVKFQNHKVKSRLYKARTKLKTIRVSDLFPSSTAATRVASERIYLNENLTSYRRELLKQANQKRKEGLLVSAWSIDGKIFIKTSPEGRPLRVYDKNDLENLFVISCIILSVTGDRNQSEVRRRESLTVFCLFFISVLYIMKLCPKIFPSSVLHLLVYFLVLLSISVISNLK